MAVDFFDLPSEETLDEEPPSPIVWGLLLVIAIAAGVALTLYLWPKNRSTQDWQFYSWMFAVPTLAWALSFAARLHSYEICVWRVQGHNAERVETIRHNTNYARRPLALLGYAYDTPMGCEKLAERVVGGESELITRAVRNTKEVRAHSELPRNGYPSIEDLIDVAIDGLLAKIAPLLQGIPSDAPVEVWLDIRDEAADAEHGVVWESIRRTLGVKARRIVSLGDDERVMALDAWLDNDTPAAVKYVLIVAIQLRTEVPADSGEAAVALLFGWPSRVDSDRRTAIALVHRPTVSPSGHDRTALDTALDWGGARADAIERTWVSGLTELRRNSGLVLASQATADEVPVTADLDAALGHTGAACGWLAIAAAAERCRATDAIQFISTEAKRQPCWLVVSPLSSNYET
jgi:hypothetical protein